METQNAKATELRYRDEVYSELGKQYYMNHIVVDGIESTRPQHLYDNPVVSLKGDDSGVAMHYKADFEIAEEHWLNCGHILAIGEYCPKCGGPELVKW